MAGVQVTVRIWVNDRLQVPTPFATRSGHNRYVNLCTDAQGRFTLEGYHGYSAEIIGLQGQEYFYASGLPYAFNPFADAMGQWHMPEPAHPEQFVMRRDR